MGLTNPLEGRGADPAVMAGVLVLGALAVLVVLRKGFHGINIG